MDASTQASSFITVGEQMPWVGITLKQTELAAGCIPEDRLDWRPTDPSGRWAFSLGEIAMHCADIRLMFAKQLRGEDSSELYWLAPPPQRGGTWTRKREPGRLQEILDSLARGRTELEEWLARPYSEILTPSPGLAAAFEQYLQAVREAGKDTAAAERRGPTTLCRLFMTVACHEAGHRGALQANLRLLGISVPEEE